MSDELNSLRNRMRYAEDVPVGRVKCYGQTESVQKAGDTSRIIQTIFTTDDVDLGGDVILPEGADFDFHFNKNGRRVFVDHEYTMDSHIGVARRVEPYEVNGVQRGWRAHVHVFAGPRGDDILTVAEVAGIGASIGLRPFEMGPPTEDERKRFPKASNIIRKYGVLEFSLTAMPQNSACQGGVMTRSTVEELVLAKSISVETARLFGYTEPKAEPEPKKRVILW